MALSVSSRTALVAALAVVAAYGGMLWWGSELLQRQTMFEQQLSSLAGNTEAPLALPYDATQVFGIALTVSMAAVLLVFLALLRYGIDRRTTLPRETEPLSRLAGMVAVQQSQLDDLLQRLDASSANISATGDTTTQANEPAESGAAAKSIPAPLPLTRLPHVLRTPLHGILGHVQNLRRDSTTSPAHSDALEAIENNGRQLLDLLNDLVDLSQLESGERELASQPLSLQQIVNEALAEVAHFAGERSVSLQPNRSPPLPWTNGDSARLRRLLVRLLRSAVGSQSISPGERTLRLDIRHENDRLTVSLFGQNRTADAAEAGSPETGSDVYTETDLDYLVGSRMVALFDGDVLRDVTSGAFSARLPFETKAPQESMPEPHIGLPAHIHCRLMVVEPRPEIEPVCDALLGGAQCTIEAERDLASARRRLQDDPFDLVLLGIEGAAKNAEEAAAELRLVAAGDPAVITVRQLDATNRWTAADDTGFDAVLDRPIDPDALINTVGELLVKPLQGATDVAEPSQAAPWPQPLGRDTAARIDAAVDLGDIESLQGLCDELSLTGEAPAEDIASLNRAVRLFDLDALRRLAARCMAASSENSDDA